MKFCPLTASESEKDALQAEYKEGREIGRIRFGETQFFFRSMRRVYYLPYSEIRRYFRRVMMVPARLCCGKGNFQMENLVICGDDGELAQIGLPGVKAAKIVMECMAKLAPQAVCGKPKEQEEQVDDRQ